MNLFNKFENKYYDILEDLLSSEELLNKEEIKEIVLKKINNKDMNDENKGFLLDIIGDENKNIGHIFKKLKNEKYISYINQEIPFLLNNIEKQAVYSIASTENASYFLEDETIEKIKDLQKEEENLVLWNKANIKIKNQAQNGDSLKGKQQGKALRDILKAIINKKSIKYKYSPLFSPVSCCDDLREVYPYKIEYSLANDKIRICAYIDIEDRFIKMNLDRMECISIGDSDLNVDLDEKFKKFREEKLRTLVLSIEPKLNNVERSFRIFSYYERIATYLKEDDIYILEIKYNDGDKAELIRDIMSLGDGVMVLEPSDIRNLIIERAQKCVRNYDNL